MTIAGVVMAVAGIILTVAFLILGGMAMVGSAGRNLGMYRMATLPMFITIFGIILVVIGLFSGAKEAWGDHRKQPVRQAGPCYVISCQPFVGETEMVFDVDMYDPSELRWFIKMRFPNGSTREFETAPEVVSTLGEGLWGNITYQGRWLSGFQRVLVDRQR